MLEILMSDRLKQLIKLAEDSVIFLIYLGLQGDKYFAKSYHYNCYYFRDYFINLN